MEPKNSTTCRKAVWADKEKVIAVLCKTFDQNPGVNWLLRKRGNHPKKIKRLMSYAFVKAYFRDGVYLSNNGEGVALCYQHNKSVFSLKEIFYELRFVFTAVNLLRLKQISKRENYRKKQRPQTKDYFYFWFFGVVQNSNGTAYALKNFILEEANKSKTPIYVETAMKRNQLIYERFGFETYHYWENQKEGITFWFMKWEP